MLVAYGATVRGFSRNVRLFLFINLLVGFGLDGGVFSVLFNLYLLRLGYGPEAVGQINSVGLLVFALSSLPAGVLGNRYSSRLMMGLGLALCALGGIALPGGEFAPTLQTPWIMASYGLIMLGLALFFVNGTPFIMDSSVDGERTHVFAAQSALLAAASFVGALIGGYMPGWFGQALGLALGHPAPYRYALLIAAIFLLPALVAIFSTTEVNHLPVSQRPAAAVTSGRVGATLPLTLIGALLTIRFFQVAGIATTGTFLNVYLDSALQVSTSHIGLIAASGRLLAVPVILLTPIVTGRFGNLRVAVVSGLVAGASFIPMALVPHWSMAALSYMGVVAISAMRYPATMVFVMGVVSPRQQGPVAGAGEMAGGLSFTLMALIGGYLIVTQGYPTLFLLAGGLTMLGAIIFWILFKSYRRR